MSFFTYQQDSVLKTILNDILKEGTNKKAIELIKEHDLMEALKKDMHIEELKEDVRDVIEERGFDMTMDEGDVSRITDVLVDSVEIDIDYIEHVVENYEKYMHEEDYNGEIVFRYFH